MLLVIDLPSYIVGGDYKRSVAMRWRSSLGTLGSDSPPLQLLDPLMTPFQYQTKVQNPIV